MSRRADAWLTVVVVGMLAFIIYILAAARAEASDKVPGENTGRIYSERHDDTMCIYRPLDGPPEYYVSIMLKGDVECPPYLEKEDETDN
jgi:hypothetical protein